MFFYIQMLNTALKTIIILLFLINTDEYMQDSFYN